MEMNNWKEFSSNVHKDLNKCFELDGEYPSFNYPTINFTDKSDYASLWGFLYNEIYQNDKCILKDLMRKHLEFQNFEKFIGQCLAKGYKLPRTINIEEMSIPELEDPTQDSPHCGKFK